MSNSILLACRLACAAFVALFIFTACGSRADLAAQTASKALPPGLAGLKLPAPLELEKRAVSAFTDGDRIKHGEGYTPMIPINLCTDAGEDALFSPAWSDVPSHLIGNVAYAGYQFDLTGYTGPQDLYFSWGGTGAGDLSECWIGLANFTLNRWDWVNLPASDKMNVPAMMTDYKSLSDQFFVVTLFLGTTQWQLSWLSAGYPPVQVQITATPPHCIPNIVEVQFDATGSDTPNGVAKYEWDLDGDGAFELDTDTTPTCAKTYTVAGLIHPAVRITGPDGITGTASTTLYVYSETEPNNNRLASDSFPMLPFTTWCGSIGTGTDYPGYDGGNLDYAFIGVIPGQTIMVTIYPQDTADVAMALYSNSGSTMVSVDTQGLGGAETMRYTVKPTDLGPYALEISAVSGFGDYYIEAYRKHPPKVELTADPQTGAAPLEVAFDASGSSDSDGTIVSFEWDWDGDGTYESNTGTTSTVSHMYTTAGSFDPKLKITDNDGFAATATLNVLVTNPLYDEIENNDSQSQVNVLPDPGFFGWKGSIGNGPGYGGYDGDGADYLGLTSQQGDTITTYLHYDPQTALVDMSLYDANQRLLDSSMSPSGTLMINHTFQPADEAPYYLLVHVMNGYSDYLLDLVPGTPPTASFTADPESGDAPLAVDFDGSASSDPDGPLAKFEWDWDGDGVYDYDSGTDPTADHVYDTDGLYRCYLRVTDSSGLTATTNLVITVGANPYDEVEDNDSRAQANSVSFPIGFFGSLGIGPGYAGYDGDGDDYLTFSAIWNQVFSSSMTVAATADIDYELQDSTGRVLSSSLNRGLGAAESITYTFIAGDASPYFLHIIRHEGYGDYSITATLE